jgi:hypothetical protein
VLIACQQSADKPATSGAPGPSTARGELGHERGDCRPDKSCDANLMCLSNVCVRPPGADCAKVAENMASYELGNYAEPEDRAPVVAKLKAKCDELMVTKEEGDCILGVKDKWAAAKCVPRLYPEMASGADNGQCAAIAKKIGAALDAQQGYSRNPQMKGWFDVTMKTLETSCLDDKWPDALKSCALAADLNGNAMGMQYACQKDMPPELTQKMQERMSKAMSDWQASQNH